MLVKVFTPEKWPQQLFSCFKRRFRFSFSVKNYPKTAIAWESTQGDESTDCAALCNADGLQVL